jgi:hypothetical protein
MPKRSGKPKKAAPRTTRELNRESRAALDRIGEIAKENPGKDPAAVALGRKGGLVGGPARMNSLTAEERKKLALKAARARWGK